MTTIAVGGKAKPPKDEQKADQVVIEHENGRLEVLEDCERKLGLIIHAETRQVFPEPGEVPRYTLSLDGDYAELDSPVDYYYDELKDPVDDPDFVFGASVAACEAAENGEMGETETQKCHARLQLIACIDGVAFPLLALAVAAGITGGLPWRGG